MRRQYHFRPTPDGTLVWDVHRLIASSRGLPVIEVPLSEIRELDEAFWFAATDDVPTCRAVAKHAALIDACDLTHPIILSSDGRVMDGMHRVCKALNLGNTTIRAVRFEADPPPDHVDVAAEDLPYDDAE